MKYSKEVISFCIEILKNERGCIPLRPTCDKCLIRDGCHNFSNSNLTKFSTNVSSKKRAEQIIKEIIFKD